MIKRFCLLTVISFYTIMIFELVQESKKLFQGTNVEGIAQVLRAMKEFK